MDIYAVNIINKLNVGLYEIFLSFIDENKKLKINKFKNNDDKIRTLVGDILIRSIICNRLHIFNKEIEYEYNSYGKPNLKNNKGFYFNISHSGIWVVAVVDYRPVGIDIEKVSTIDYTSIARRFFKNDEYRWLLAQKKNKRLEDFYKLWTLKESYIKMVGTGLTMPLNSFSIIFDNSRDIHLTVNNDFARNSYFKTYIIDREYMIAVCSENDNFASRVHIINYDEMYKVLK